MFSFTQLGYGSPKGEVRMSSSAIYQCGKGVYQGGHLNQQTKNYFKDAKV
jgi:hypothetical protein